MARKTVRTHKVTTALLAATMVAAVPVSAGARPLSGVKLTIAGVSVVEGNTGSAMAAFTVHAGGKGYRKATVRYRTSAGSATEASDFTPVQGTISFQSGRTQKVLVPVLGDTVDEPDETYSVELYEPTGARINAPAAVGTIVDDDAASDGSSGDGGSEDGGTVDGGGDGETDGGAGDGGSEDGGTVDGGGDGTDAGTDTARSESRISLAIVKRTRIVARGKLFPAHAGKRVRVRLLKKVDGRFVLVRTHRPLLGAARDFDNDGSFESKYRTTFRKPRAKRCRVVVRFAGDVDHKPSSARRTFDC